MQKECTEQILTPLGGTGSGNFFTKINCFHWMFTSTALTLHCLPNLFTSYLICLKTFYFWLLHRSQSHLTDWTVPATRRSYITSFFPVTEDCRQIQLWMENIGGPQWWRWGRRSTSRPRVKDSNHGSIAILLFSLFPHMIRLSLPLIFTVWW